MNHGTAELLVRLEWKIDFLYLARRSSIMNGAAKWIHSHRDKSFGIFFIHIFIYINVTGELMRLLRQWLNSGGKSVIFVSLLR